LEYGPRFAHPHNCLGLVALQCRADLDAAAEHFKAAIALRADFAEAHNNLGTTFFRRDPPDYSAACERFAAALDIDPSYLDARENYGLCLLRRGTIQGTLGDADARAQRFAEARSHFRRLLELDRERPDVHHHLGFMDVEQQRWSSAESELTRCIDLAPEHAYCHYNLGYVFLKTGRCDDAVGAFVSALRSAQGDEVAIGARQNLGLAYAECADRDEVIARFIDRLRRDPSDAALHVDLGRLYAEAGHPSRARAEQRRALALDPTRCDAHAELVALSLSGPSEAAKAAGDDTELARRCRGLVTCVEALGDGRSERLGVDAAVEQCREALGDDGRR